MKSNLRPINRCFLRRLSALTLMGSGAVWFLGTMLHGSTPLIPMAMIVVGLSFVVKDWKLGTVLAAVPALIGLEALVGMVPGATVLASVGIVWLSIMRVFEH